MMGRRPLSVLLGAISALCSCSSSSGSPAAPRLAIVTASGDPLHAVAGDALELQVVLVDADGATHPLPGGASVTWTSPAVVTALTPDSTAPSPLPVAGAEPTAAWIVNPSRPDRASDLANVLFILDPGTVQNGTIQVAATVAGASPSGPVSATLAVDPTPAGDWTRGAALYGSGGADCAVCHGADGHGSPGAPNATSYSINGTTYDYPAPGLDSDPGNTAGDPAWNAALFAMAARADVDNGGLTLRVPMPDWLALPNPTTGQPLSTQDLADIFAFLKTQPQ